MAVPDCGNPEKIFCNELILAMTVTEIKKLGRRTPISYKSRCRSAYCILLPCVNNEKICNKQKSKGDHQ
jgi:hypothetical protein